MKIRIEHTNCAGWCFGFVEQAFGNQHRLFAHVAFNVTALAVDAVQRFGQFIGAGRVVGQQAFNAQGHVGQTACRVDAWAQGKAKIEGGGGFGTAARCYKKSSYPRLTGVVSDSF